jgi:hypothetical protein
MSCQYDADDPVLPYCGKAGIRVSFQIPINPLAAVIHRIQGSSALFRTVPKFEELIIIIDCDQSRRVAFYFHTAYSFGLLHLFKIIIRYHLPAIISPKRVNQ